MNARYRRRRRRRCRLCDLRRRDGRRRGTAGGRGVEEQGTRDARAALSMCVRAGLGGVERWSGRVCDPTFPALPRGARRLNFLGHVSRLPDTALAKRMLFSVPTGVPPHATLGVLCSRKHGYRLAAWRTRAAVGIGSGLSPTPSGNARNANITYSPTHPSNISRYGCASNFNGMWYHNVWLLLRGQESHTWEPSCRSVPELSNRRNSLLMYIFSYYSPTHTYNANRPAIDILGAQHSTHAFLLDIAQVLVAHDQLMQTFGSAMGDGMRRGQPPELEVDLRMITMHGVRMATNAHGAGRSSVAAGQPKLC
eukprot:365328-Chlamydomonas_euryale.AAC.3